MNNQWANETNAQGETSPVQALLNQLFEELSTTDSEICRIISSLSFVVADALDVPPPPVGAASPTLKAVMPSGIERQLNDLIHGFAVNRRALASLRERLRV